MRILPFSLRVSYCEWGMSNEHEREHMNDALISTTEAASRLGLTPRRVRQMIDGGELEAQALPYRRLFLSAEAVDALVEARRVLTLQRLSQLSQARRPVQARKGLAP